MVFFYKENDPIKRINFLKSLERLSFLLLLSNDYYYSITIIHPITFLNWATALSKNTLTVEKLIKEIEEKRQSIINNKEWLEKIKAAFKNEGFYKWQGIKYFLYEYELHLQNQSKTNRDKMNWHEFIENRNENENEFDYKTIEHIYPQNPRKECWTSRFSNYNSREKNILRHSLGNLLPLSQPKNSTFQNKCFSEKVSGIDSMIGYEYGSYSEIEVSKYNDWTAKKVLERGIKLLDFMEKNWNIIIGDKKQKADFINLNFVISKENINL
ncbi:HNH endonuclease family protein [Nostoc sp.]|uniref:HNH endonuclease family protein n=1 Tax=Nostoc sp. TaxID=1180 RepID=UPI002FFA72FA